jgi:hypothetical protein
MFITRRVADKPAVQITDLNPLPKPSVADVQAAYPNGICRSGCTCNDDFHIIMGGKLITSCSRVQYLRDWLGDVNRTEIHSDLFVPSRDYLYSVAQQTYWSHLQDFQKRRFEVFGTRLRHIWPTPIVNRGFDRDAPIPPCVSHKFDALVDMDHIYVQAVSKNRTMFFFQPRKWLNDNPSMVDTDGQPNFDVARDQATMFVRNHVACERCVTGLEDDCVSKLTSFSNWQEMDPRIRAVVKRTMTVPDVPAPLLATIQEKLSSSTIPSLATREPTVPEALGRTGEGNPGEGKDNLERDYPSSIVTQPDETRLSDVVLGATFSVSRPRYAKPMFAISTRSPPSPRIAAAKRGDIANGVHHFGLSNNEIGETSIGCQKNKSVTSSNSSRNLKRDFDEEAQDVIVKKKGKTIESFFNKKSQGKEVVQKDNDDAAKVDVAKEDDSDDDTEEMSTVSTGSIGY